MKKSICNILTLFIIFNLVSCNSSLEKTVLNSNGTIEYVIKYNSLDDTSKYHIKYFNKNGSLKCEGNKSKGEKSNKWKYYNENGVIKSVENYSNGLLTDTQAYYFSDGKLDRYKILDNPISCFCDSCENYGFSQVAFWRNGKLREINHIKNCEFNGITQIFDSITGNLNLKFNEINGLKNGEYKKFYKDSSIMMGNYKNGKPIGKWITIKGKSIISEKEY